MSRRAGRGFEEAIAVIEERMLAAVGETLRADSAEPARAVIDGFVAVDEEVAVPDEPPPGETLALVVVAGWFERHRERDAGADAALDWIGAHLGRRFRARARYVRGFLDGEPREALGYADALGEDFLPALLWLAAGLVACHGDGDVAWLAGDNLTREVSRP